MNKFRSLSTLAVILTSTLILSGCMHEQQSAVTTSPSPLATPLATVQPKVDAPLEKVTNSYAMIDGKMMAVIDGMVTKMEKEVKLTTGDVVMLNGKVKLAGGDGKTVTLKNGDSIMIDGTLKMALPTPVIKQGKELNKQNTILINPSPTSTGSVEAKVIEGKPVPAAQ